MIAYKLLRQKKNGELTSLFINKKNNLPLNKWIRAKGFKTKGFKYRPFWHSVLKMDAPHLSKNGRVWAKVEIKNFSKFNRPNSQGGIWYLSKLLKIKEIIK